MVSLVGEIVSENLNAEESLPALLLALDLINTHQWISLEQPGTKTTKRNPNNPPQRNSTTKQKKEKGGWGWVHSSLGSTTLSPPKNGPGSTAALNHNTENGRGSVLAAPQASSQPLHVSPPTSGCCPSPQLGKLFGANSNHHFRAQKQTRILLQASRKLPLPYGLSRARSSAYVSKGAISPLCTEGGTCFSDLIRRRVAAQLDSFPFLPLLFTKHTATAPCLSEGHHARCWTSFPAVKGSLVAHLHGSDRPGTSS